MVIIINSIQIIEVPNNLGWVDINVNTSGSGTFGLSVNGIEKQTGNEYTGTITLYIGTGTFNICAYDVNDKLNTTKCQSIVIGSDVIITNFLVGADNYPATQTRNFIVVGYGSGTYQIKEGSTVIATRTLPTSGTDTFDINNIPAGSHTYCAQTKCVTFTIVINPVFDKWSCSDNCSVADTTGEYNSKAECLAACTPPSESLSLTVDKASVTVGDKVNFVASWNKPDGTIINLYQAVPLGADFLVGTGSLVGGYVTIPHIFAVAGTVVYYACSPGILGDCANESNRLTVAIASKTTTYIIYAAGALALAYIAGQYLSSQNRGKVK